MLCKEAEFGDTELPIVSLCLIADKSRCPANFTAITKCSDDGSEADLWRDSFGFGIFNRVTRYMAISRIAPENTPHEVITDMAIITEKEAVPTNFVCIDYTADTKERALKKKFICVRFTPRSDALDALTDVIVQSKNRKPPKGYTSAGEVDGALICFRVQTIPESYGVKQRQPLQPSLYPSLDPTPLPAGTSNPLPNLGVCTIRAGQHPIKGLEGIEFKLNPRLVSTNASGAKEPDPELPDSYNFTYNFNLERSCLA
ncbi:unnamed protein product [Bursaphelenchus xylophilus]|uniref:(pine wood nematode) hypothetical protein n=1 Tax=Bursaphelenchus xylophilus TaxID=6326 RepID=A0A1I7SX37_BURXY|nr:unnamed protein product [Bursaphelenchus xylophilus]CAG9100150.1 unnamed protein product [Bursaphelenchus xylophilus]